MKQLSQKRADQKLLKELRKERKKASLEQQEKAALEQEKLAEEPEVVHKALVE